MAEVKVHPQTSQALGKCPCCDANLLLILNQYSIERADEVVVETDLALVAAPALVVEVKGG